MAYKRIRAAVHNFAHSFMSGLNFVDGEIVSDVIRSLLPRQTGGELRFHFPDGAIEPARDYPGSLRRSVDAYANRYARHLCDEGVDPAQVREATIVVTVAPRGIRCYAEAVDDRGRRYRADVIPD